MLLPHPMRPKQFHTLHYLNIQMDLSIPVHLKIYNIISVLVIRYFYQTYSWQKLIVTLPGRRQSSDISTPSICIIPVIEALKENLPLIIGVSKPLLICLLSKMKPLITLSSVFAQTIKISAIGELVILEKYKHKNIIHLFLT